MPAKSAKSRRAKGQLLENYVADQIREKGLDPRAKRDGASGAGTREKGDIDTSLMILGQNAGIEVKNWDTVSIAEWWRQVRKLESLGREPVLVFKLKSEPLQGTLATIYLDTLLELIKAAGGAKIPQNQELPYEMTLDPQKARTIKYKAEMASRAAKELAKEFDL